MAAAGARAVTENTVTRLEWYHGACQLESLEASLKFRALCRCPSEHTRLLRRRHPGIFQGHAEEGWEPPWPHLTTCSTTLIETSQHHLFFCSIASWQGRAAHHPAHGLFPYSSVFEALTDIHFIFLFPRRTHRAMAKRKST